jgi:hypothetical protein
MIRISLQRQVQDQLTCWRTTTSIYRHQICRHRSQPWNTQDNQTYDPEGFARLTLKDVLKIEQRAQLPEEQSWVFPPTPKVQVWRVPWYLNTSLPRRLLRRAYIYDLIKVNDKGSTYLYRSYGIRNDLFSMTLKIFLIVGKLPVPNALLNLCCTTEPLTFFNYAIILKLPT